MTLATAPVQGSRLSSLAGVTPLVFVVDDDISVRESLPPLIAYAGWRPEVFASAREFLTRPPAACPSCLVLDVSLPDMSGLELQKEIAGARADMPIIFITGRGDVSMSVQAMKAGAVEFLTKPFSSDALLDAIRDALKRSEGILEERASLRLLHERHESLTEREREVMALVVRGHLNKQVGGVLGISEITVKGHRGRVMRKMGAKSLPDLVNIGTRIGLRTADDV